MIIVSVNHKNLHILLNLAQAYEAEFSPLTKKNPNSEGVYPLDVTLDDNHPSFILFDKETPVGFCIKRTVNDVHDIADFYIIPTYRKQGLARNFVIEIFKKYVGDWQTQQIEGADYATAFVRSTVNIFTNGEYKEMITNDPYWGKVTRQLFKSI